MFNISRRCFCAIVVIAAGGIPKGYDEGGFSASITLPSFQADFNLVKSNWTSDASGLATRNANITSFGVLGAALGSLAALFVNEHLSRLQAWRFYVLVWASGLLMQVFSSGMFGLLLFARIWAGLGAGALTVVTPLYLSEIAPARSRGRVTSSYMVALLLFLALGFFINYAASVQMVADRMQYRLVQSIPLIPVGIAFFCSFFLSETPRWLALHHRHTEGLAVMKTLRSGRTDEATSVQEYREIEAETARQYSEMASNSLLGVMKEILQTPTYRTRLLLVLFMATVAQWSGGNGITYYIPQIFEYAGVSGSAVSLLSSGAYGVTKLVFTLLFVWCLVDFIGRRPCFLAGLTLQFAAHIYMAIYTKIFLDSGNRAASAAAIASVFWYAIGWSIGLCMIQSLYAVEIFPTRVRSVAYAASMALHWFFQFAVVKTTPNLLVATNIWGAFVFWAAICAVGLLILGLWAPETKGVPMERMGEIFSGKWWTLWKNHQSVDQRGNEFGTFGRSDSQNLKLGSEVEELEKV